MSMLSTTHELLLYDLYIMTTQQAKQMWSLKTGGHRWQGGMDHN